MLYSFEFTWVLHIYGFIWGFQDGAANTYMSQMLAFEYDDDCVFNIFNMGIGITAFLMNIAGSFVDLERKNDLIVFSIFTIAFGIAVDDTIHFLTKLRLELAKGKSLPYAIKRTFIGTGKAIIVTSLILCGGFLTLIGSDF